MYKAQDKEGATALYCAAMNDHTEIVKMLLAANANVQTQSSFEWTALHRAAFSGHIELVKILLVENANVQAQNRFGETALHGACYEWPCRDNQTIIGKWSNHKTVDNQGRTPTQIALLNEANEGPEIVKLIMEYSQQLKIEARKAPQKIAELKEIIQQQ